MRVLVVGQTPPPFGGQAVMIAAMLGGDYRRVRLYHVRMAFSREMDDIGRFQAGKLLHLVMLVFKIWYARLRYRPQILYYPPAGPDRVPFYRDLVLLLATRWLFRYTVFHFHAGGISELYPRLAVPLRLLFRLAYRRPDVAVRSSPLNPDDGDALGARHDVIIPIGIADSAGGPIIRPRRPDEVARILFVGVLRESKGVLVLLEACKILAERGLPFALDLVGKPVSPAFAQQLAERVRDYGLSGRVRLPGVLTGAAKDRVFREAHIFCFPTFFEAETFGVVLLEAMQYSLPLVATRWRGLPSLVHAGQNGLLVPIHDPLAVAEALAPLITDPALAERLGAVGRADYEQHYTLERYCRRLEEIFVALVDGGIDELSRVH